MMGAVIDELGAAIGIGSRCVRTGAAHTRQRVNHIHWQSLPRGPPSQTPDSADTSVTAASSRSFHLNGALSAARRLKPRAPLDQPTRPGTPTSRHATLHPEEREPCPSRLAGGLPRTLGAVGIGH